MNYERCEGCGCIKEYGIDCGICKVLEDDEIKLAAMIFPPPTSTEARIE